MPEETVQYMGTAPQASSGAAAFPYHEQIVYEAMVRTLNEDVIPFDDSERAFWFREHWLSHVEAHAECKEQYAAQFETYQRLALLCGFVALQRLSEEEFLELVRTQLIASSEIPLYELRRKIEVRLLFFPHPEERNEFRDKVRDALLANEEAFPPPPPHAAAPQNARLTIRDWLKKYRGSSNAAKQGDRLARQNFVYTDPDAKKLSDDERERLLAILEVFDWILLRSDEPEGFEEGFTVIKNGKPMRYRYGHLQSAYDAEAERIIKEAIEYGDQQGLWKKEDMYKEPEENKELEETVAPPTTPEVRGGAEDDLAQYQKLERVYQDWMVQSAIATAWKMKEGAVNKDSSALMEDFYSGINAKDASAAVSALVGLTASRNLRAAFRVSERYQRYWGKHIGKYVSAEMAQAYPFDPAGQPFLVPFLRHVLTERLKLSEHDALMVGVLLSNFARNAGEEEYANMAYGDLATGAFKWNS